MVRSSIHDLSFLRRIHRDRENWNLGKREKPNVTFGPGIWFGWVGMIVLLAGGIALGKFSVRS